MNATLRGPSPAVLTAGILLLSRARRFGMRIDVTIAGDPAAITPVEGPTAVHSAVLASCGVGRELGAGALVIVPGAPAEALAVCMDEHGVGDWFLVDRAGDGVHPATRAFVRLCRDSRAQARELARTLRRATTVLGITPEPALFDLLFGAPAPPLVRLAATVRAGRAMTGARPEPMSRWTAASADDLPDPLPSPCTPQAVLEARQDGRLERLMARLSPAVRDRVDDWMEDAQTLARDDAPWVLDLVAALAEVASHALSLPAHAVLAPLDPSMDAVAVALGPAIGASGGQTDANRALADTFRFLGGRFDAGATGGIVVGSEPAPVDRLARWGWLCREAHGAAEKADALWVRISDPVQ